ncbi:MAG: acyltransferase [Anaerolineales bacterium]|jgi:acetyltransferase-like isoleucine patch superfamily enzyme
MRLNDFFSRVSRFVQKLLHGGTYRIEKTIRGQGNVFDAKGASLSEVRVDIIGVNNRIVVGPGCMLSNVYFRIRGSGHRIEFGSNCRVSRGAVLWFEDREGVLQVGSGTTMVEVHIAVTENSRVIIGEDCMFANDIDIRTGDSHSVINAQTGERLNFAGNVVISRHVWIAPHTVILKGVAIGENSIIATGAVVTKSCDPGVIMGGNPAKVIKTGVSWKRERVTRN